MGKEAKLSLKELIMIMGLVGTVLSAFIYLNSNHADAAELQDFKVHAQREFSQIRIERIVNELNSISRREAAGFLTKYDKIRKDELEREWELLKGKKNAN